MSQNNFINNYMQFTAETESHPNFHLFSCFVALSSLVSRKVWVPMGIFDVFPNLYVVLVAPPGTVRKTTAMSVCKKLLRSFTNEVVPLSAECQTKEALVLEMSKNERTVKIGNDIFVYTPITVCVTELSQFVGAASAHMVDFLTAVYDEPMYRHSTKNQGEQIINGPYLTMLGCTTPDWITARLKDDVISGGFSRRCLFVYENQKTKRIPRPTILPAQRAAWELLVKRAKEILTLRGPFRWDDEAGAFFDAWYTNLRPPNDPILGVYYESKHIQLLKIAMLLAVSDSNDLTLRKEHLTNGLEVLDLIERNIPKVFQSIGRNEAFAVGNKVIEMLEMAPNHILPARVIKERMARDATFAEIPQILLHLKQTDQIEELMQKGDDPTKPSAIYIRLKK